MLWECLECHTPYACDLQACPNCGSTDREEYGMPKITVANGATNKNEEGESWPQETTSSPSTKKQPSTPETSEAAPQQPARTTGSRSRKARAGSSSARSVTTSGPETDASSDE